VTAPASTSRSPGGGGGGSVSVAAVAAVAGRRGDLVLHRRRGGAAGRRCGEVVVSVLVTNTRHGRNERDGGVMAATPTIQGQRAVSLVGQFCAGVVAVVVVERRVGRPYGQP